MVDRQKLLATHFLKATGLLDAYESVIDSMITNGWPETSTIYDHAAYELLRWYALNREDYQRIVAPKNPGPQIKPTPSVHHLRPEAHSNNRVIDASVNSQVPLSEQNRQHTAVRSSQAPPSDVQRISLKS